MKSLTGIIPALVTPFTVQGKINTDALAEIVDLNVKKGVDGFYACGSTAEAFLMSIDERKLALEVIIEAAAGRVPVICHIGAIGTDLSIELGKHAEKAGAYAISSIPPFYYKFSPEEIIRYYMDLACTVDLPCILYNFPALSGFTLTYEIISRLRKTPNIIGVKFTSNDLYQLERIKANDPDVTVYNGYDEIFIAGLMLGVDGAIGSTFNVMAEKFLQIRKEFLLGNYELALSLQKEANSVIEVLNSSGAFFNSLKYLLNLKGIQAGVCRAPFLPLTDSAKEKLDAIYEEMLV